MEIAQDVFVFYNISEVLISSQIQFLSYNF